MKIDIRKRYSFKYVDDLILYMLENGLYLEHGDLWHIFNNMNTKKPSNKYNKLGSAIVYLLNECEGSVKEHLVQVLNKHFDYLSYGKTYEYICNNKLIEQYLIKLEKETRKSTSCLV